MRCITSPAARPFRSDLVTASSPASPQTPPPFRLDPKVHALPKGTPKPSAAALAADESAVVAWKAELVNWRESRGELRILIERLSPSRGAPGPVAAKRLSEIEASVRSVLTGVARATTPEDRTALADQVTRELLPHMIASRGMQERGRLAAPDTYGPPPAPPVDAIRRLLAQPSEQKRLRIVRPNYDKTSPSLSAWWVQFIGRCSTQTPMVQIADDGTRSIGRGAWTYRGTGASYFGHSDIDLLWALEHRDEQPVWETMRQLWQDAMDQWIAEMRHEQIEWSPLWNKIGETVWPADELHDGPQQHRLFDHPSVAKGWWGQSQGSGPVDVTFPRSTAWLSQYDLQPDDLAAHVKQAGAWRLAVWRHSPSVVQPSSLLDRLRTMRGEELRALFQNPHLTPAAVRLVRNWALFDLTQPSSNTPSWDSQDGLSTLVLNSLSAAGQPLSPDDLERLEHALVFSTSPGMRGRIARIQDVLLQPWAAEKLFPVTKKGQLSLESISRLVGAAHLLRPEDWSVQLTRLLEIDDAVIGSPNIQARALTKVLGRATTETLRQTTKAQWRTLLLHDKKEVREMAVRRMGDLALRPEDQLETSVDGPAPDQPPVSEAPAGIVIPRRARRY